MRVLSLIALILVTSTLSYASTDSDSKWFACKRFSNCIKVTGNICNRATAVHTKYQSEYLEHVEKLQGEDACEPISDEQVQEDLIKRPTCRDGKCILIVPKTKD